jgi:hypothetical protein
MPLLFKLKRSAAMSALLAAVVCLAPLSFARADMVDHLDLKSDEFTKADVTRDDVVAAIAKAGTDGTADFSGRRLNGPSTSPAPTSRASCSIRRGR